MFETTTQFNIMEPEKWHFGIRASFWKADIFRLHVELGECRSKFLQEQKFEETYQRIGIFSNFGGENTSWKYNMTEITPYRALVVTPAEDLTHFIPGSASHISWESWESFIATLNKGLINSHSTPEN